jgi:hypothetical protein
LLRPQLVLLLEIEQAGLELGAILTEQFVEQPSESVTTTLYEPADKLLIV